MRLSKKEQIRHNKRLLWVADSRLSYYSNFKSILDQVEFLYKIKNNRGKL